MRKVPLAAQIGLTSIEAKVKWCMAMIADLSRASHQPDAAVTARQEIWIGARNMTARVTNGAASGTRDSGASDVASDDDGHVVIAAPEDFNSVRDGLEKPFGPAESARLAWRPKTSTVIDDETAASLFKLIEALEDSDDVQNVYANFEVGEDVLARLSA